MIKIQIDQLLEKHFQPTYLQVIDDSGRHAGHAEARTSGGGHYAVHIISKVFENKSLIERHRMVYDALTNLMGESIHALALKIQTPAEAAD